MPPVAGTPPDPVSRLGERNGPTDLPAPDSDKPRGFWGNLFKKRK